MKCRYCDFEVKDSREHDGMNILKAHFKKVHPTEYKKFRSFMGGSYGFGLKMTKEHYFMNED
jgi:hypothetical protein